MFYEDGYFGQPAAPSSYGQASPGNPGAVLPGDEPVGHQGRRLRRRAGALGALVAAAASAGVGGALSATAPVTSGTSAATLSVRQVEATIDPALVDVVTTLDYGEGEAAGTGIVLTSKGEVLTNNHVVEGATTIRVTDVGNGKTYSASVVGYDETADVAVLQLKGASGLKTATLAPSTSIGVGASVVAIGNAGGVGGAPSAATGTVTALDQSITASDEATGTSEQLHGLIATDADIQAGDSGGPLVDLQGQVIGMDTAGSSDFQFEGGLYGGSAKPQTTTGYAVPVGTALALAKQMEAGRSSAAVHIGPSAFLGVQVANTSSYYGQGLGFTGNQPGGADIEGVVPGSPAAVSGLGTYDTITSIAGRAVTSLSSLQAVMNALHPGQRVIVRWVDPYGISHTAKIKLASGPVG